MIISMASQGAQLPKCQLYYCVFTLGDLVVVCFYYIILPSGVVKTSRALTVYSGHYVQILHTCIERNITRHARYVTQVMPTETI